MGYEKLNDVLEKALAEINEYCLSIHSKVVFLGHVESPELLIYPHFTLIDPLGTGVNVSSMHKSKSREILEILTRNGISATFGRDRDTNSIEFLGTIKKGASHLA